MHVNPELKEKALAMFFNPTDKEITREIEVPLHYAGLTYKVSVRREEGVSSTYTLSSDQKITLKVTIPALGFTWYVFDKYPRKEQNALDGKSPRQNEREGE